MEKRRARSWYENILSNNCCEANETPEAKKVDNRHIINCDQAAWFLDAVNRLREATVLSGRYPSVSRLENAAKFAFFLEVQEVLGCKYDDGAMGNIIRGCFRELSDVR